MSIAEAAVTVALAFAAKMLGSAVLPIQTVIKGFPVASCFPILDMVFDFLSNSGWILA